MPRRKHYKTILSPHLRKPIEIEPFTLPLEEQPEGNIKILQKEHLEKVVLKAGIECFKKTMGLFKHYGINPDDPNAWRHLAINLCRDYVPEFKIAPKKPKGKPRTWDDVGLYILWYEVEYKAETYPNKSRLNACRHLIKKKPWCDLLQRGTQPHKSLYEWYLKAKKSRYVIGFNEINDQYMQRGIPRDVLKEVYEMVIGPSIENITKK